MTIKSTVTLSAALAGLLFLAACSKPAPPPAEEAPAPAEQTQPAQEQAQPPAEEPAPADEAPAKVEDKAQPETPPPGTKPVAVLKTDKGTIEIAFFPEKAPNHVQNFLDLCRSGFYDGTKFHRVIPNFMIQGGDPNTRMGPPDTWGMGGKTNEFGNEVTLKAEFNDLHHVRGIVSMARSMDPDSASSQFFICVADYPSLDGKYTVFGKVIKGMDVVDKIVNAPRDTANDRPLQPVAIEKATVEYRPTGGKH
jgi:peptidyl-prolyl cis-trans isomerase B (cyclophilin B)